MWTMPGIKTHLTYLFGLWRKKEYFAAYYQGKYDIRCLHLMMIAVHKRHNCLYLKLFVSHMQWEMSDKQT